MRGTAHAAPPQASGGDIIAFVVTATVTPLDWTCTPLDVVTAWPDEAPLMMLHSARPEVSHARWSVLAAPRAVLQLGERSTWTELVSPVGLEVPDLDHDPLVDLGILDTGSQNDDRGLPFLGGWLGFLSYELGRVIEPAVHRNPVTSPPANDRDWPLGVLGWCPDALAYDNISQAWYAIGDPARALPAGRAPKRGAFRSGTPRSGVDPDTYLAMVAATIDYIAAGDIFQANITHRLSASFEGSTRRLCVSALAAAGAWYGAYLELPGGRCVLSLSPELFLEVSDARVTTRPIKGTRPSADDPETLLHSAKDAAELNMIVDLMRNDLGRVCRFGSVKVPKPRVIETHPTVHHGVGEVTGVLREGLGRIDLLRAAFPAGSVTGAPKIRAMQIIEELEPVCRGPYCGAVGLWSACGRMTLNVAIRTIALSGTRRDGCWSALEGTLDYGVGGGIVADSDPIAEYRETMDKAAILRQVLRTKRYETLRNTTKRYETNM